MSVEIDWPASAADLTLRESRSGMAVFAGYALTLALIAGLMFLVYTGNRTTKDAETSVEHTGDVAAALDNAAGAINDMDRTAGRYLLTGATRYLSARDADANAAENHLRRLRVLLAGDSVQLGQLATVEPLWTAMLSRFPDARTTLAARTAETESLCDDISAQFAKMRGEEGLLLAQQRAELQLSINAQPSAFLVLSILASAMLCVFYILAIHSIRQSREARKVLKDTRRRADAQSSTQNISMARSHCDIRSALTAILGYCDLSPESETTAKDRFDSIRRQACQIIAAVNNILNIRDVADATSPLSRSRMDALSPSAGVLSDAPTTQRPARRFTGRVLLAEDNRDLQQIIKFYLQAAGAEVTIAPDGQLAHDQALFALKEHKPFDLILMDVQMPNSDGCAATILLRGAGYTNPIVALTANATDRERGRCVAAGCNGFLTKPVDQEDFLRTMQRYLQPDVSADSEFAALRESFQAEIPSRIAEIGTAVSADNFSRVANLTHQLMGTAGCYGLTAVCAAATALNAAAERPETRETIRQYFQTLIEQTAPTAMPKAA